MKIYYDPPEEIDFVEATFGNLLKSASLDESKLELLTIMQPIFKFTNGLYNDKQISFFEQKKLKLMWALRSLESEIEAEDGFFLIKSATGELAMQDFSVELTAKIKQHLLELGKL